ncbi:MAG: SUMF1/EgtB/PvdO family nonheme iron enzyme [Pseudomonadota bacterium]
MSEMNGETYRLPSEAEWEYAGRADTSSAYAFGDELMNEEANINARKTKEAGAYRANAWGLHDMHGGVEEWCSNHWHDSYLNTPADGSSWTSTAASDRTTRGGTWIDNALAVRSACRSYFDPQDGDEFTGFRCARVLT